MSETPALLVAILLTPGSVITQKGDSAAVAIDGAQNRVFLLTFEVEEAVEQECLELHIQGSVDGLTWNAQPVAMLPQRFYVGKYPTLLDLTTDPSVRFVRVHWEVSRWGRGDLSPRFTSSLSLREVPETLLIEARAEAQARR